MRVELPQGQWVEVLDVLNNGQRKRLIRTMNGVEETAAIADRLDVMDEVMCNVIVNGSWCPDGATVALIDELALDVHDAAAQAVNDALGRLLPDFGVTPDPETPTVPSNV